MRVVIDDIVKTAKGNKRWNGQAITKLLGDTGSMLFILKILAEVDSTGIGKNERFSFDWQPTKGIFVGVNLASSFSKVGESEEQVERYYSSKNENFESIDGETGLKETIEIITAKLNEKIDIGGKDISLIEHILDKKKPFKHLKGMKAKFDFRNTKRIVHQTYKVLTTQYDNIDSSRYEDKQPLKPLKTLIANMRKVYAVTKDSIDNIEEFKPMANIDFNKIIEGLNELKLIPPKTIEAGKVKRDRFGRVVRDAEGKKIIPTYGGSKAIESILDEEEKEANISNAKALKTILLQLEILSKKYKKTLKEEKETNKDTKGGDEIENPADEEHNWGLDETDLI
jgi:CRISPR/Cas system CMR-associated protein Cmr5 small subunit